MRYLFHKTGRIICVSGNKTKQIAQILACSFLAVAASLTMSCSTIDEGHKKTFRTGPFVLEVEQREDTVYYSGYNPLGSLFNATVGSSGSATGIRVDSYYYIRRGR